MKLRHAAVIAVAVILVVYVSAMNRSTAMAQDPESLEWFVVQDDIATPDANADSARALGRVARAIDLVVDEMVVRSVPDPVTAQRAKKRWSMIRSSPMGFRETSAHESAAAYTVNKSDQVRVCIRKNGVLQNFNDTVFVMLHELGHIMSESFGHNQEFQDNFSAAAMVAVDIGVYQYTDYSQTPTQYCGVDITMPAFS